MDQKNDVSSYFRIKEIMKQFATCRYEEGLDIEIKDFLQWTKEVEKFTKMFDERSGYKVSISLKEFNHRNARSVFIKLVQFIEYTGATIYAREQTRDSIHYVLASFSESGLSFYCEIDFS